jgi:hypothetical protein
MILNDEWGEVDHEARGAYFEAFYGHFPEMTEESGVEEASYQVLLNWSCGDSNKLRVRWIKTVLLPSVERSSYD